MNGPPPFPSPRFVKRGIEPVRLVLILLAAVLVGLAVGWQAGELLP
jgi:hypothetical protein